MDDNVEEILSISSFFESNISPHHLFRVYHLSDALEECFFKPPNERKILILYFHNESDEFSKTFCSLLNNNREINEIIKESFILLGWDVESEKYQSALKIALNNVVDLSCLEHFLLKKKAAATIIIPVDGSFQICSILKDKIKERDIITVLKEAKKIFQEEMKCEDLIPANDEEVFNSEAFLQFMCDGMNDRDYDSFEDDEHELLKKKIAYAFFGPPKKCEKCLKKDEKNLNNSLKNGDCLEKDIKNNLNNSCDNCGKYSRKEEKTIKKFYDIIIRESDEIVKWKGRVIISFIYICMEPLPKEKENKINKAKKRGQNYDPNSDFLPIPIFILRKCKGNVKSPCRVIIDNVGRIYKSWTDFIISNKLPKCEMIIPKNGQYNNDENGKILLEKHLSPACGIDKKILNVADIGSSVIGAGAGGVGVFTAVATTIAVPPIALAVAGGAGIAVGAYGIGRGIHSIVDRRIHKENLSLANSEARLAYLNIAAGSLGFIGFGANIALTQLAARGVNIGQSAKVAFNFLQCINLGTSGVALGNSGYDMIDKWLKDGVKPSTFAILQFSSSLLFFGNAVYNFRMASTIVEETQTNTLKNISESLRSNRHRKTFTRLIKETIKRNDGDVVIGRAEVISSMRNIRNQDEVFASLTRSTKLFNQNDIKFSSKNGNICLNGVPIEMSDFVKFNKNQVNTYIKALPNAPEPSLIKVETVNIQIKQTLMGCSKTLIEHIIKISPVIIKEVSSLAQSDESIQDKIINAFTSVVMELKNYIFLLIQKLFPEINVYLKVFQIIVKCFDEMMKNAEEEYKQWELNGKDPTLEKWYFKILPYLEPIQYAVTIFKGATDFYFSGNRLNDKGRKKIEEYIHTFLAVKIDDYETTKERKEKRTKDKVKREKVCCQICGGEYYKK